MYGLSNGEKFDFFVALAFRSFSVSRHQVSLVFVAPSAAAETATITVESCIGIKFPRQNELVFELLPSASLELVELLDLIVVDVTSDQSGVLALEFTNGAIIRIFDSFEHYESYQIFHNGDVFVV